METDNIIHINYIWMIVIFVIVIILIYFIFTKCFINPMNNNKNCMYENYYQNMNYDNTYYQDKGYYQDKIHRNSALQPINNEYPYYINEMEEENPDNYNILNSKTNNNSAGQSYTQIDDTRWS
jgi:cell division protein FtsW (lipid II flippase)